MVYAFYIDLGCLMQLMFEVSQDIIQAIDRDIETKKMILTTINK